MPKTGRQEALEQLFWLIVQACMAMAACLPAANQAQMPPHQSLGKNQSAKSALPN